MKRLIWSPRAVRDLEVIRDYIALDSPAYADLVVQRLVRAPERLQQFPDRVASCPSAANWISAS